MRAFPISTAAVILLSAPAQAQQPAPREKPALRATQPVPSREAQPAVPRGQQPAGQQPVTPSRPPGTPEDRAAKEKVQREADERDRRRETRMRRVLRSICSRC